MASMMPLVPLNLCCFAEVHVDIFQAAKMWFKNSQCHARALCVLGHVDLLLLATLESKKRRAWYGFIHVN